MMCHMRERVPQRFASRHRLTFESVNLLLPLAWGHGLKVLSALIEGEGEDFDRGLLVGILWPNERRSTPRL